jgi:membrane-bound ClpP family serine protease
MITLNSLAELSRSNCISICAFLVPANLVATSLVLWLTFIQVPTSQMLAVSAIASTLALALFLHVGTWFIIGVIMPPTFILCGLGLTCLVVNYIALVHRQKVYEAWQMLRLMLRLSNS